MPRGWRDEEEREQVGKELRENLRFARDPPARHPPTSSPPAALLTLLNGF